MVQLQSFFGIIAFIVHQIGATKTKDGTDTHPACKFYKDIYWSGSVFAVSHTRHDL